MNVTVPVAFAGTVAVKVTDWPVVDGSFEDVRVTVGSVLATVWLVVPVAGLLLESPP
jgi:hypothetical protein